MVFSSIIFLFYFFPLFLLLYYGSPRNLKNPLILIFSIIFYAWGAPKFIFVVLLSMIVNFFLVGELSKNTKNKKFYLLSSLLINVGILAFFKYSNFFVDNLNGVLKIIGFKSVSWTRIALPIGISFFTFQSITYTMDVYRGVHKPLSKLSDYLVYILMFPQLVAGPIIRFNTIADQIINRKSNETLLNRILGFQRFCIGLAKKVMIANTIGEGVDSIYAVMPDDLSSLAIWVAALGYTMQIYFDFSGYSDMAIGIGRMIGFQFPENFNNPYISKSISEFWRRWHITLGEWMRDYLYIPLGGNKVKTTRLFLNLWIVFLLSGLWHGASWNFVAWGAFHGFFLILDRLFFLNFLKRIGQVPSIIVTFFITLVGWVIFRIENIGDGFLYLQKMFLFSGSALELPNKLQFITFLFIALVFSFVTLTNIGKKAEKYMYFSSNYTNGQLTINFIVSLVILIFSVSYITASGFNPFIYFRF